MNTNLFTNEEVQFLINNADTLTISEMAKKLNRPYESIRSKANKLHINVTNRSKPHLRKGYVEYILYSFNEIKVGTLEDLASHVGMKVEDLMKYRVKDNRRNVIFM